MYTLRLPRYHELEQKNICGKTLNTKITKKGNAFGKTRLCENNDSGLNHQHDVKKVLFYCVDYIENHLMIVSFLKLLLS